MEHIPCNLCGRDRTRLFIRKFKLDLDLVKCRGCGLVYACPRFTEQEIMKKRYTADYFNNEYLPVFQAAPDSYNMDIIRSHYHQFLSLAAPDFKPGRKLLDIGCGAGFFLKAARELGWDVEGVELSESAASYAQKVLDLPVRQGKFENCAIPDETFDVVTLQDTIEHLAFPLQILIEVRRVLKRGGLLMLNTPDLNSLSRFFLGRAWAVLSPAEHLTYFTEKTLSRMLARAGFEALGIRNLLNFNPEYTHDKAHRRYRRWKDIHDWLSKQKIMEKIYWFEYNDLLSLNQGKSEDDRDAGSFTGLEKIIYQKAKGILRGDMLVALARK